MERQPLPILLISSSPEDAARLEPQFTAHDGLSFSLEIATTLAAGLHTLALRPCAVVLLALDLPDSQGIDALTRLHEAYPLCPVVVLTTGDEPDISEQLIRLGAQAHLAIEDAQGAALFGTLGYAVVRAHSTQQAHNGFSQAVTALPEQDVAEGRLAELSLRDVIKAVNVSLEQDEVLARILENVGKVVPHDAANIMFIEGGFARIAHSRGYSHRDGAQDARTQRYRVVEQTGTLRTMRDTRKPLTISDVSQSAIWDPRSPTDWVRSYAAAPILVGDEVIGFLNLDSRIRGRFQAVHGEILQAFANQVAITIQNVRLFAANRKRAEEQAVLRRIMMDMVTHYDLSELLRVSMEKVLEILDVDAGEIFLYEHGTRTLKWAISIGDPLADPDMHLPRGVGLGGRVWETLQPIIVEDYSSWPHALETYRSANLRGAVGVPLLWGNDFLGVILTWVVAPSERKFIEADTRLLREFGDQLAAAITNTRLYQELENYSSILEQAVEEATREITQARDNVEAILNSVGEAIMVVGTDGIIDKVNPAFVEQTGYTIREAVHKHHGNLMLAPGGQRNVLHDAIGAAREGKVWRGQGIVTRKDSRDYDAAVTVTPLLDQSGQVQGYVGSLRDISAMVQIQRMKDAFLSTAAHELRTPLTSIRGFSELLLERNLDQERRTRYLNIIHSQTVKIAQIIDDLLDVSRLEARRGMDIHPEPVSLCELLEDVMQSLVEITPGHTFEIHCDDGIPPISLDSFRIKQVVRNLLSNAIKYSPDGGRVILRGEMRPDSVWVSIQDEGIGMTPEQQTHLFEKFYRADDSNTSIGGTGLGLTISKLIVELHGGSVWAESVHGMGSTFYFSLPLDNDRIE